MKLSWFRILGYTSLFAASLATLRAETGAAGWLRYALITDPTALAQDQSLPAATVALDHSQIVVTAQREFDPWNSRNAPPKFA